ncbi:hypothetical protein TNCV_4750261 [Trichonephila clavipes]|nr:hypothetical protein TNCV_4750261 [Trichonephila clavipes]
MLNRATDITGYPNICIETLSKAKFQTLLDSSLPKSYIAAASRWESAPGWNGRSKSGVYYPGRANQGVKAIPICSVKCIAGRLVICPRRTLSIDHRTSSELQPLRHRRSEIVEPLCFSSVVQIWDSRKATDVDSSYTICDFSTFYKFKSITSFLYNYASLKSDEQLADLHLKHERDEQRALRLENLRVHATETRSSESSDQREVRLETDRIRTNQIRSSERTELRKSRLQNVRISTARSRRTLHAD